MTKDNSVTIDRETAQDLKYWGEILLMSIKDHKKDEKDLMEILRQIHEQLETPSSSVALQYLDLNLLTHAVSHVLVETHENRAISGGTWESGSTAVLKASEAMGIMVQVDNVEAFLDRIGA